MAQAKRDKRSKGIVFAHFPKHEVDETDSVHIGKGYSVHDDMHMRKGTKMFWKDNELSSAYIFSMDTISLNSVAPKAGLLQTGPFRKWNERENKQLEACLVNRLHM